MFKDVPNSVNFVAQEHKILDFWRDNKVFDQLKTARRDAPRWSFIDGPITANNPMGVHHAWGRTYKDLFHRFKAMQGFQTRYQNGFDCQGLWIEVNVERDMGFKSKKDIEAYGMAEFANACKRQVLRHAATQTEQSIRLGYWMDWNDPELLRELESKMAMEPSQVITVEGPQGSVTDTVEQIVGRLGLPELGGSYFTFSNENNYTIWTILKRCLRARLDLQRHRRHAVVFSLRYRHQPTRDRHRRLPRPDTYQHLSSLPFARPTGRKFTGLDDNAMDFDQQCRGGGASGFDLRSRRTGGSAFLVE